MGRPAGGSGAGPEHWGHARAMTDIASRQETFSGTKEVVEALRFDEDRLADYLHEHVDGFRGPLEVRQFKGGQSNPTYQLITPERRYVLRRKPPGKLLPSAHAVNREYRVITALGQTDFPVPRTYHLCTDDAVVGTMFYVMECVEGRVLWEPALPGLSPEQRAAIWDAQNTGIAQLHGIDFTAIGLDDFGKHSDYLARQIHRWAKQYVASETEQIAEMDRLMDWLPANIPPADECTIVHGDFRLDNMILHPTKPRILAVLDWELCTLGHPLADFSYHMLQWHMPDGAFHGLSDADLAARGMPTEREYVAAYCERTNRAAVDNLDYYLAYNFFRLAGILQGIVGRVRDGTAASAHAVERAATVRPTAELAFQFAQRAGLA